MTLNLIRNSSPDGNRVGDGEARHNVVCYQCSVWGGAAFGNRVLLCTTSYGGDQRRQRTVGG
jgi:hypothetical protein